MQNRGFIYKIIDYKESSKIIYLYTKEGKKSFKALGVNKKNNKFSSVLITSNIIEYSLTSGDFPSLVEGEAMYSFMNKLENIKIVEALRIIIELINLMPDDVNNERFYAFLEITLINLVSNPNKVLAIFLIKSLYLFGINPNFNECIKCHTKNNLIEISALGGALCSNCGDNHNYDIWKEYYFDKKDILAYSDTDFNKLFKEINEYYLSNLNIDLKIK